MTEDTPPKNVDDYPFVIHPKAFENSPKQVPMIVYIDDQGNLVDGKTRPYVERRVIGSATVKNDGNMDVAFNTDVTPEIYNRLFKDSNRNYYSIGFKTIPPKKD